MSTGQHISRDSNQIPLKLKFNLQSSKLDTYAKNAIKKSNVRAFVNQGLGMSQKSILQNNENNELSGHLLSLKQSDSIIRRNIHKRNSETVKLKDDIQFTADKVLHLKNQKQLLEEKINKLTKDLIHVSEKKQNTLYTFKSYEQILTRMKKDQINNQIRKNLLQKKLLQTQKQYKQTQKKLYNIISFQQLCAKGLLEAQQQVNENALKRQKTIIQMSHSLQSKNIDQIKKIQRMNQTNSIQQMAAGDLQDADLTRMKKFMRAQMFLKHLLKDKMKKLKQFYEPFEFAFFKIKSQTVVKEASLLKFQFFNFEQNYQQRTVWVKDLQNQIALLQIQRKNLKQESRKSQEHYIDLVSQYQNQHQKNTEDETINEKHLRQNIQKQNIKAEIAMTKLNQWINLQAKRINDKPNLGQHPQKKNITNFNTILNYLLKVKNQNKPTQTNSEVKSKYNNQQKPLQFSKENQNQAKCQQNVQQKAEEKVEAQIEQKNQEKTEKKIE